MASNVLQGDTLAAPDTDEAWTIVPAAATTIAYCVQDSLSIASSESSPSETAPISLLPGAAAAGASAPSVHQRQPASSDALERPLVTTSPIRSRQSQRTLHAVSSPPPSDARNATITAAPDKAPTQPQPQPHPNPNAPLARRAATTVPASQARSSADILGVKYMTVNTLLSMGLVVGFVVSCLLITKGSLQNTFSSQATNIDHLAPVQNVSRAPPSCPASAVPCLGAAWTEAHARAFDAFETASVDVLNASLHASAAVGWSLSHMQDSERHMRRKKALLSAAQSEVQTLLLELQSSQASSLVFAAAQAEAARAAFVARLSSIAPLYHTPVANAAGNVHGLMGDVNGTESALLHSFRAWQQGLQQVDGSLSIFTVSARSTAAKYRDVAAWMAAEHHAPPFFAAPLIAARAKLGSAQDEIVRWGGMARSRLWSGTQWAAKNAERAGASVGAQMGHAKERVAQVVSAARDRYTAALDAAPPPVAHAVHYAQRALGTTSALRGSIAQPCQWLAGRMPHIFDAFCQTRLTRPKQPVTIALPASRKDIEAQAPSSSSMKNWLCGKNSSSVALASPATKAAASAEHASFHADEPHEEDVIKTADAEAVYWAQLLHASTVLDEAVARLAEAFSVLRPVLDIRLDAPGGEEDSTECAGLRRFRLRVLDTITSLAAPHLLHAQA